MDNRWWSGETQVLDRGEVVSAAEGNAAWLLMMAEGSQLSDGSYRIELSENGMLVTTIPLRIGN